MTNVIVYFASESTKTHVLKFLREWNCFRTLGDHTSSVTGVFAWGDILVTTSYDCRVRFWRDGQLEHNHYLFSPITWVQNYVRIYSVYLYCSSLLLEYNITLGIKLSFRSTGCWFSTKTSHLVGQLVNFCCCDNLSVSDQTHRLDN